MASGGLDKTIFLWDVPTLTSLTATNNTVTSEWFNTSPEPHPSMIQCSAPPTHPSIHLLSCCTCSHASPRICVADESLEEERILKNCWAEGRKDFKNIEDYLIVKTGKHLIKKRYLEGVRVVIYLSSSSPHLCNPLSFFSHGPPGVCIQYRHEPRSHHYHIWINGKSE